MGDDYIRCDGPEIRYRRSSDLGAERVVNLKAVPATLQKVVDSLYARMGDGSSSDKPLVKFLNEFEGEVGKCIGELDKDSIYFLMEEGSFCVFFSRIRHMKTRDEEKLVGKAIEEAFINFIGHLAKRLRQLDAEERVGGACGKDGQPCACREVASSVKGNLNRVTGNGPLFDGV